MRTTRTLSITLPPEMLARAEELARNEHRTMSELMREALRHYDRDRRWDEVNAFGRKTAEAAGVRTGGDVVDSIHRLRQQRRTRPVPAR
jgi:predicted transcriptional regulator